MAPLENSQNGSQQSPNGIRNMTRSGLAVALAFAAGGCIKGTETRETEQVAPEAAESELEQDGDEETADATTPTPRSTPPQEIGAEEEPGADEELPPRDGIDCAPSGEYQAPPQEIADVLALLLWRGKPDEKLQAAVDAGQLSTPEQVGQQIERMLMSSEALNHLDGFAEWWLDLPWKPEDTLRNLEQELGLTLEQAEEVLAAIRTETRLFMRSLLQSPNATLKDFLTSREAYVSPATAGLYGVQLDESGTVAVTLPPERAGGILTQLGFLTDSHNIGASFIGRGYFMQTRFLCQLNLPEGIHVEWPETTPPMPWREWWEGFYGRCAGCHDHGPALGYGFDNFDQLGRTRTDMRGMPWGNEELYPVDNHVQLNIPGLPLKTYASATETLQDIASAESLGVCFAKHWLAYLLGRPVDFARSDASLLGVVHDGTACSRQRGESYQADVIFSLVGSRLLLDHAFPCGPELCISSEELCLEMTDAQSDTNDFSCVAKDRVQYLDRDDNCRLQQSREGALHYSCTQ